jgi:hypothetical protein
MVAPRENCYGACQKIDRILNLEDVVPDLTEKMYLFQQAVTSHGLIFIYNIIPKSERGFDWAI